MAGRGRIAGGVRSEGVAEGGGGRSPGVVPSPAGGLAPPADVLRGRVALVAGATRGAGRGIAVELGAAGAAVYVSGRSSRVAGPSEMGRPETVEETAELVGAAGGTGIAVPTDHHDTEAVRRLVERIDREQGRLDLLVNDVWGGDPLTEWHRPVWELDVDRVLRLLRQAVETHIITAHHALRLMVRHPGGLAVEVGDGTAEDNASYRDSLGYDLAKWSVLRLGFAFGTELARHGCHAVAVTPGWLRSEAMLDGFGVTEANWRDACAREPHFRASETPRYLGRAVAALGADPGVAELNGRSYSSGQLARRYGFTDLDGSRPHFSEYFAQHMAGEVAEAAG